MFIYWPYFIPKRTYSHMDIYLNIFQMSKCTQFLVRFIIFKWYHIFITDLMCNIIHLTQNHVLFQIMKIGNLWPFWLVIVAVLILEACGRFGCVAVFTRNRWPHPLVISSCYLSTFFWHIYNIPSKYGVFMNKINFYTCFDWINSGKGIFTETYFIQVKYLQTKHTWYMWHFSYFHSTSSCVLGCHRLGWS